MHANDLRKCSIIRIGWQSKPREKVNLILAVWADAGMFDRETEYLQIVAPAARETCTKTDKSFLGTPASVEITTCPPILGWTHIEIGALVKGWLHSCQAHHDGCRRHLSLERSEEDFVDLPTRLLLVTGEDEGIVVRLVETGHSKGRYCALSHCWGSKDKQPLRTINDNLQDHLAGIPFNQLPLTFKHAALLVQDLGVDYLWIDSLCINQDDEKEWRNESAKMGEIYKNAALVIAAAGSKDSTEGLFVTKSPEPFVSRFPYLTKNESIMGTYNVALQLQEGDILATSMLEGPLRSRAWAFQEWYMSHRTVFFALEGIIWKCHEGCHDERNNYRVFGTFEHRSWTELLGQYSGKELTYEKDRLLAIDGIVNEMRKSRSDNYRFGVWENNLNQQLLWMFSKFHTQKLNVLDLPSWCWAATEWNKKWLANSIESLNSIDVGLALRDSGVLDATGSLLRTRVSQHPMSECCLVPVVYFPQPVTVPERLMSWGVARNGDNGLNCFLLHDVEMADRIFGMAVFDGREYCQEAFCFFLASNDRLSDDPW